MVSSVCLCHLLPQRLIFNIALLLQIILWHWLHPPPPAPDRSSNDVIRISHQEMRDATEENLQS